MDGKPENKKNKYRLWEDCFAEQFEDKLSKDFAREIVREFTFNATKNIPYLQNTNVGIS